MKDLQKDTAPKPAFSKVGMRASGIALHTSNHPTTTALSAWK